MPARKTAQRKSSRSKPQSDSGTEKKPAKAETEPRQSEDSATVLIFQCTNCGDEVEKLERCSHCNAPLKLLTTIDSNEVKDLDGIDGSEEKNPEGNDTLDTIIEDKLDDDPPSIDEIGDGDEDMEEPIVPDDDLDKLVDPLPE